jgi:transposase
MSHSSLITGPERRRRWHDDEKHAILVAAFSPGAVVVEVARQYEISTSLIYKWRSEAMAMATRTPGDFVPAVIVEDPPETKATVQPAPAIVVELAGGVRVTIGASAPVSMVSATLRALR